MPFVKPFRSSWENGFPDVLIHAAESVIKKHPSYPAAKAGNVDAAIELVITTLNDDVIESLIDLGDSLINLAGDFYDVKRPVLVSVHAEEAVGVNAIPEAMADILGQILGWEVEQFVVQANVVNHTGAGGFARLARQAVFEGEIIPERDYVIVDDFIGQGGTIANLRGHILRQGGIVVGATVLTGKDYSAILALENKYLAELRDKHGQVEEWWRGRFGFGFECLTASEARYLIRTPASETIRARIEEADAET